MLAVLAGCAGTKSHDSKNLTTNSQGRYIARDTSRTVDLTNPPSDAWDRIRRGFAIPNLNTELSQQWTDYYASHPESVQRMAERAGKYLYFIVDEINRRGLPTELALLPFVESAYNRPVARPGLRPVAVRAGHGPALQPETGLVARRASRSHRLDQRGAGLPGKTVRNAGRLVPALASYNWGEGSVQRAMAKNEAAGQPTDYLSLSMPDETRNYVPKLQAIKNIIADPQRYAVALPPVGNTPYFVTVRKNSDIDLEIAAKLAEMPLDEFKALNPSFNRPVIRGDHAPTLLLPADRVEIFNANLTNYKGDLSAWKVYHSRRGESRPSPSASASARPSCAKPRHRLAPEGRGRPVMLVPGDPGPGGIQVASLAPPSARWIPRRPAARPRHMAARRRRLRPASPAPAPTSAPIRSGRATPCSRWPSSTAPRSTLRALNNLKGNALKVGGQLRVPGTNARGRGPRALRASPGRRSGPASRLRAALVWRGPGLVWLAGREACH